MVLKMVEDQIISSFLHRLFDLNLLILPLMELLILVVLEMMEAIDSCLFGLKVLILIILLVNVLRNVGTWILLMISLESNIDRNVTVERVVTSSLLMVSRKNSATSLAPVMRGSCAAATII